MESEHLATNEKVVGSSPSVFTIISGSSNRQDGWL